MEPIKTSNQLTYADMVKTVIELTSRINVLTQMKAVIVDANASARFVISNKSAALDLPNYGELIDKLKQELEECEEALEECNEVVSALKSQINILIAQITPDEDANGNGQWSHTTLVSTGCRVGNPIVSCAHTDKLSMEHVNGNTFKFRRVNSAKCCGVDGGVTVCAPGDVVFGVFTSPDLTSPIDLGLDGNRGVTSESDKALANGTYYVTARGVNIFKPDCSGFYALEPYQYLGTFTIDGAELTRTFDMTVTVAE